MAYYLELFSPETLEVFNNTDKGVASVPYRLRAQASKVKPGDKLLCYVTKISRWIGVLEVVGESYLDKTPIFAAENDPYPVRLKVKPIIWLPPDKAVPIKHPPIWSSLSFTSNVEPSSPSWTGKLRMSLTSISQADGKIIEQRLAGQLGSNAETFPIDERELKSNRVHRTDKTVSVSVPDKDRTPESDEKTSEAEVRQSIKVQALLAHVGAQMGFKIWIPKADRGQVLSQWKDGESHLLQMLPLNYDEVTLKTIEQIDVLWLRNRSIVRAFEVEHTTSIYSGILRMADLLALQPNMDIRLHIVAPEARRDKVFQEIRRPVFSLLEKGPLSESCTYLAYESVEGLAKEKHLPHLSDTVLDDYSEPAE